jgi:hypothetical protein
MLTIFTTAKPFEGHSAIIQRNALKSWTLLHPGVEVILFGDDPGAAEISRELNIRHVPEVQRVSKGPKVLRSFFDAAQRMARHEIVCYANCDIILMDDFMRAVRSVRAKYERFLMLGRRWDAEISEPLPFDRPDWAEEIQNTARKTGLQRNGGWVDYFVFPRGLYLERLPEFVIGRVVWDHWLVWKARSSGVPVIDASEAVVAIHQNHDYAYHPAGRSGVWNDELAKRNEALAGSGWHRCTIDDATHVLRPEVPRKNPRKNRQRVMRFSSTLWQSSRLAVLDWTRPLRHALGLRKTRTPMPVTPKGDALPAGQPSTGNTHLMATK